MMWRPAVGLGVPFVSVLLSVPLLSSARTVYGMPAAVAWLFACMPLTAICLALCWFLHDRHMDDER
jgi:hypothetical protein